MTDAGADAARRLWATAAGRVTSPEDVGAAAQRVCDDLRAGLSRWVGADGYRALLERALQISSRQHPVLNSFSCYDGDAMAAIAAARARGAAELASGIMSLVATMTDLLGRIIGEEMAARLIEQTVIPNSRPGRARRRGGRDG